MRMINIKSISQAIVKRKKEIFLLIITLVLCITTIEIILRIEYPSQSINKYGWSLGENYSKLETINDRYNTTRIVNITYYDHGFKRWGDTRTNKTKIFIIGDSFAEMRYVGNGEEYYSYLEKEFDIELFVYGAGGYGTLQEYMVFDDYVDEIKPDMVIWQFYFNDFINNVYDFDRREYPLNNHGYRPFLENNKIVYRLPSPLGELRKYSKIIELSMNIIDNILWSNLIGEKEKKDLFYHKVYGKRFWENDFAEAKVFDGRFDDALNLTSHILSKAKKRYEKADFYLFSADDRLFKYEKEMCKNANITYIEGITEYLKESEDKGIEVKVVNDAHWNFEGNKLVGEFLVKYFKEKNLLH